MFKSKKTSLKLAALFGFTLIIGACSSANNEELLIDNTDDSLNDTRPQIVVFSAIEDKIVAGQTDTIYWQTQNAPYVYLLSDHQNFGLVEATGSIDLTIEQNTHFSLIASQTEIDPNGMNGLVDTQLAETLPANSIFRSIDVVIITREETAVVDGNNEDYSPDPICSQEELGADIYDQVIVNGAPTRPIIDGETVVLTVTTLWNDESWEVELQPSKRTTYKLAFEHCGRTLFKRLPLNFEIKKFEGVNTHSSAAIAAIYPHEDGLIYAKANGELWFAENLEFPGYRLVNADRRVTFDWWEADALGRVRTDYSVDFSDSRPFHYVKQADEACGNALFMASGNEGAYGLAYRTTHDPELDGLLTFQGLGDAVGESPFMYMQSSLMNHLFLPVHFTLPGALVYADLEATKAEDGTIRPPVLSDEVIGRELYISHSEGLAKVSNCNTNSITSDNFDFIEIPSDTDSSTGRLLPYLWGVELDDRYFIASRQAVYSRTEESSWVWGTDEFDFNGRVTALKVLDEKLYLATTEELLTYNGRAWKVISGVENALAAYQFNKEAYLFLTDDGLYLHKDNKQTDSLLSFFEGDTVPAIPQKPDLIFWQDAAGNEQLILLGADGRLMKLNLDE